MSSRNEFLEALAENAEQQRVNVWPMPAYLLTVVGEGQNAHIRRDLLAFATSEGRKLYPEFYCRQFGVELSVLKKEIIGMAQRGLFTVEDHKTAKGHTYLEFTGTPGLQAALYDAREEARAKFNGR